MSQDGGPDRLKWSGDSPAFSAVVEHVNPGTLLAWAYEVQCGCGAMGISGRKTSRDAAFGEAKARISQLRCDCCSDDWQSD
jgi:hypothetical protein